MTIKHNAIFADLSLTPFPWASSATQLPAITIRKITTYRYIRLYCCTTSIITTNSTHVDVAHHLLSGNGGVDATDAALMYVDIEFHALESS